MEDEMAESPKTNWRLLRIAESICSCLLTDGFCGPKNKPDCRCWIAARAAMNGIINQANPCLLEAWPRMFNDDERRGNLNMLVKAILTKEDELTAMHKAEAGTAS
jgi:hypothetical protein